MHRRKLIQLAILGAISFLAMATPSNSEPTAAWKRYQLNVKNVYTCAFTPDSHQVAFYYWTSRLLSEKPWKAVYTSHVSVWDFGTGKIEEKFKSQYTDKGSHDPWATDPRYMQFTADGRRLVLFNSNEMDVFDVPSYKLERQIPFSRPSEKVADDDAWAVVSYFGPGFSLTPDGSRAAVALSSSIGGNGGFVRVYDLKTGQIVREWRLRDSTQYVAGVALSPDGKRVAVSTLPIGRSSDPEAFIPPSMDNVRVMDVKTGETVAGLNTKYVAGPVLFAPNDMLLTASINDDRKGYSLDTVKVWDAKSGKLLREITDPRTGVHYRLDLSPDGKLLLGYTGTEKPVENFVNIDTQQFQIWDFASGKVLATSPRFLPIGNEPPHLLLSPDGRYVLVWWGDGTARPVVFEIPQP